MKRLIYNCRTFLFKATRIICRAIINLVKDNTNDDINVSVTCTRTVFTKYRRKNAIAETQLYTPV